MESRDSWTQTFRFHPPEIHEVLFLCALHITSRLYCPQLLSYFEEIGYDVSIIVSKWFITLFAYVLPFLPSLFPLDASFPIALPLMGFHSAPSRRSSSLPCSTGRE